MRILPLSLGVIHFIGIGGIGMSGIAEVLCNLGYKVQGSDISESPNVQRLREMGIVIHIGHSKENVFEEDGTAVAFVVRSSAVKPDNLEVIAANEAGIPVIRRAEMLAELARLKWSIAVGGTHGKTTTTSLIGQVLEGAGKDPTIINGGIINAYGSNTHMGKGEWMVLEADESDGTFTELPAVIGVITNIDPEHLDFYGSFDAVKEAFKQFVRNLPFYGFAVVCIDHPEVRDMIPEFSRRIVSYGESEDAKVRVTNIKTYEEGYEFDVEITENSGEKQVVPDMRLPMFGRYNVLNALAAIAVAYEMGLNVDRVREALAGFAGVKRRFTKTGISNGITVIDDYAHHPVEISSVLKAGRDFLEGQGSGRLIAVMQPHRYSRLSSLFDAFSSCFEDADIVVVADVYEAGEDPIPGIDKMHLAEEIRKKGKEAVYELDSPEVLAQKIYDISENGDLVICLGAGTITNWANSLPQELDKLFGETAHLARGTQ